MESTRLRTYIVANGLHTKRQTLVFELFHVGNELDSICSVLAVFAFTSVVKSCCSDNDQQDEQYDDDRKRIPASITVSIPISSMVIIMMSMMSMVHWIAVMIIFHVLRHIPHMHLFFLWHILFHFFQQCSPPIFGDIWSAILTKYVQMPQLQRVQEWNFCVQTHV